MIFSAAINGRMRLWDLILSHSQKKVFTEYHAPVVTDQQDLPQEQSSPTYRTESEAEMKAYTNPVQSPKTIRQSQVSSCVFILMTEGSTRRCT